MSFTVRKFSRKIPWGQKALTGCVTGLDQRQNSVMCRTVQQGCRELGGGGGAGISLLPTGSGDEVGKGCACVCVWQGCLLALGERLDLTISSTSKFLVPTLSQWNFPGKDVV